MLGPALFESTSGYAAMWVVTAGAIFLSLPFMAKLRGETRDRAELRGGKEAGAGASG
jgi:hypothetical protein